MCTLKNRSQVKKLLLLEKNRLHLQKWVMLEKKWVTLEKMPPVTLLKVAMEYDNARRVESNAREPMSIIETPCGVPRQMTSLPVRSLLVLAESSACRAFVLRLVCCVR